MKKLFIEKKAALVICLGALLFIQPVMAAGNPSEDEPAKAKKKTKTEKKEAKSFASLNNKSVKIYPDAVKREMHVVAKSNGGKQVDFYVFDLQGNLVQNYKMKANDHYRIAGLAKGMYVYRVFSGDEETAAGKFEIR